MTKVSVLQPSIFNTLTHIRSLFTERTPEIDGGSLVAGANFGNNTPAPPEVINENFAALQKDHPWISVRATARQVHGSDIAMVTSSGTVDGVDGLFTKQKGLALGIQVADCAAILISDRSQRAVSAIHAGWKGAAAGIHRNAVACFQAEGISPEDLFVYAGPCIGPERFEVGEEVAEHFPEAFIIRDRTNPDRKPHVDLQGFLVAELKTLGIPEQQVEADRRCTFQNPEKFHSYRRDGEKSGRMVAFIMLE